MYIHIIRHGETQGNVNRVVQTPSTPLSARGYMQIEQLAQSYCNADIGLIMSSDYDRAKLTATAIAKTLNRSVIENTSLRERNFGDLRGRAYDDISEDFFEPDYIPVAGESYEQFSLRVQDAWQQIETTASSAASDIIVVTHGLVVRCILSEILKLPSKTLAEIDIKNTCVTKIDMQNYKNIPMLCDTSHLSGDALPQSINPTKV